MKILSHRGYWKTAAEKNTPLAFERSFQLGFGTETDLRDRECGLVVSHDPAASGSLAAESLFTLHRRHDPALPLALNIKADGLQDLLVEIVRRYEPRDVFVFDMSIPDAVQWLARGVPIFTRHSDIEPHPALYSEAAGVWLDSMRHDWWSGEDVRRHLACGKRVCIVSPELHRRDHRRAWDLLQADDLLADERLMLCTDLPELAQEAFCHGD